MLCATTGAWASTVGERSRASPAAGRVSLRSPPLGAPALGHYNTLADFEIRPAASEQETVQRLELVGSCSRNSIPPPRVAPSRRDGEPERVEHRATRPRLSCCDR